MYLAFSSHLFHLQSYGIPLLLLLLNSAKGINRNILLLLYNHVQLSLTLTLFVSSFAVLVAHTLQRMPCYQALSLILLLLTQNRDLTAVKDCSGIVHVLIKNYYV